MTENEAIEKIEEFGLHHAIEDLPHSTLTVKAFNMAIKALEEIQQYRAIGTVEEFRNSMKLQRVKKPIRSDMCTCPSCGTYNESAKKRRNTVNEDIVYCWHCGQAMGINRRDVDG